MSGERNLDVLHRVLDAFNRHDLDAVMSYFTDDCIFESPRGPDPGGAASSARTRYVGGSRRASNAIPDVSYGDDEHFACGRRGVSEWTISGTTVDGDRVDVRGCDLWTFGEDGQIARKDSFWKIREP